MRLASVVNCFGDCIELLPYIIQHTRPMVDGMIVIYSKRSNRGNYIDYTLPPGDYMGFNWEPTQFRDAHQNEVTKRNFGLQKVKELGFTHFITQDLDELYEPEEFLREKERIDSENIAGMVCRVKTFVKSPYLTIGYDHCLVPFIHKITPGLQYRLKYSQYPFALDHKTRTAYIDPTRRLNITKGVVKSDITMYHYSYVRQNINLKIENSSANLRKSSALIHDDMANAKEGYFSKMYQRTLLYSPNIFNLPEFS